jgi:tRNA modification GTPase
MPTPAPDTIAAIATPPGAGAIALVRASGPEAIAILENLWDGRERPAGSPPRRVLFGRLNDPSGALIDEVLATVFHAPASYTGEDLMEISCHGNPRIASRVLEALLAGGARAAEPGEFTKRAFLNGKLDLAQAEAVAELIHAGSEAALHGARRRLAGHLSVRIHELRSAVLENAALIEFDLDFSDEDGDARPGGALADRIGETAALVHALADGYRYGRIAREGFAVVLAGVPNAGKSSLLNRLLEEPRAIVNALPGTTRDIIEENFMIDGLACRLTDTAGLRVSDDEVEREGIERTRQAVGEADLVLLIGENAAALADAATLLGPLLDPARTLRLRSKADLNPAADGSDFDLAVSARSGSGIDELRSRIAATATAGMPATDGEGPLVANLRHRECLLAAATALTAAGEVLATGRPQELAAADLRRAADALGEIIGAVTPDDLLDRIFAEFCVGK